MERETSERATEVRGVHRWRIHCNGCTGPDEKQIKDGTEVSYSPFACDATFRATRAMDQLEKHRACVLSYIGKRTPILSKVLRAEELAGTVVNGMNLCELDDVCIAAAAVLSKAWAGGGELGTIRFKNKNGLRAQD